MNLRPFRLAPIALALCGGTAPSFAAGIGDLHVTSRLGQPLRAEVRILADAEEKLQPSCFRLVPSASDEIPTLTQGRVTMQTRNGDTYLMITSAEPIDEPILMLNLQAGCGVGLTREFTLALPAPEQLPVAASTAQSDNATVAPAATWPTPVPSGTRAAVGEWQAAEGESLRSVADALYPGDKRAQRRFIRAAIDANPGVFGTAADAENQPLAAGTRLQIPSLKTQTAATRVAATRRPAPLSAAATAPRPTAAAKEEIAKTPESLEDRPHPLLEKIRAQQAGDRLQVGVKPAQTRTAETEEERLQQERERQLIRDLEDRVAAYQAAIDKIQKMETYATELKAELTRVETELAAAEAANAGQVAAAAGSAPALSVAAAPAAKPAGSRVPIWLVGLLSGGAAIALLTFLRNRRRNETEPPLLLNPTIPLPEDDASNDDAEPDADTEAGRIATTAASNIVPFSPRDDENAIDVSEHESAMELAEIMLSFGRLKAAAHTLEAYIEANPTHSVEPWVKLLEIYREAGMRQEFEAVAKRLNQTFNVRLVQWGEKSGDDGQQSLERFSHIRDRVVASWGTGDCLEYLQRLLADNRNGSRSGFPLAVLDDILFLVAILEQSRTAAKPDKVGRAA